MTDAPTPMTVIMTEDDGVPRITIVLEPCVVSSMLRDAVKAETAKLEAAKNGAYSERNQVVAVLATLFPSGTQPAPDCDGESEPWHIVYIDTPAGQCSWHYPASEAHLFSDLPPYQGEWDGHTTDEKYERLAALAKVRG